MTLTLDDLRVAGLWAADCAGRALPLFESKVGADSRPGDAIGGIMEFARGGKRTARLRALAMAAHAAAREAGDPVASAAARAAGFAAAVAYTHPLATVDQAKHILGPAVYAALARELAGGSGAGDREIERAIRRASPAVRELVQRFPAHGPGRSRLAIRYHQLDTGLRGSSAMKQSPRHEDRPGVNLDASCHPEAPHK